MVSHGKPVSKLERMKHIRRTREQFPCLMAAPDESIVHLHRAVIHQCRTKTSRIKSSTLIYQLCSVSPPVNFFVAHSGYNFSHEQRVHVENVLQIADGVEQCIALLCTIVYCSEPTKPYWDTVCLKTMSPGVASRILVTQATAAALLSAEMLLVASRLLSRLSTKKSNSAFEERWVAWSCHHKSYKSARGCKCNLPCCCFPAINAHIFT